MYRLPRAYGEIYGEQKMLLSKVHKFTSPMDPIGSTTQVTFLMLTLSVPTLKDV